VGREPGGLRGALRDRERPIPEAVWTAEQAAKPKRLLDFARAVVSFRCRPEAAFPRAFRADFCRSVA